MQVKRTNGVIAAIVIVAFAMGIFLLSVAPREQLTAQLISVDELPDYAQMCFGDPSNVLDFNTGNLDLMSDNLFDAFGATPVYAAAQDTGATALTRPPVRIARDTDPGYVAVAVNSQTDEVFLQDSNTWSMRIFNRLDNTPAGVARTEPKRVITGPTSGIQYNSHIYIDPVNGDVYTVENDVGDSFSVYAKDAGGDAKPLRSLDVGHRGYALAVDEEKQEIYVSVQSPAAIEVYRKNASGDEKPIRVIQGESTRLSDTHGIAIDAKNRLLFAANWGAVSRVSGPDSPNSTSGGRFEPPSITVYPLGATGDAVPLRVIRGTRTQLDWPATMSVDPETGELYVANSVGQSILVFRGNASADAAPVRILKGPRTGISYPLGVTIDPKNKELWVANFGNSSATVYPLTASGDVAPLRKIRSAPQGKISLRLGKLNTLAYDSIRQEVLVPNCVAHPQLAALARLAGDNTPTTRAIEGQKTLMSRTVHAFQYDAIHDEIVVSSPLAQAVLTFRGGANGNEAPLRVIQGPLTRILGVNDKVTVDPVNGEIYASTWPGYILVFDRLANGNVAPKRVLTLPNMRLPGHQYQETNGAAYVDPVSNLLFVKETSRISIYDRTASGNAEPKATIEGTQGIYAFQISPKGWIVTACAPASLCAWSLSDALNGKASPRWRIPVQELTGYGPSGIALNVADKEIIMSATGRDGGPTVRNAVITFSWPELF